ncbi:DUF2683 family protein [Pararcticibacter amylolyticus]|uniref:Uncharacterized protein n=1 Tax=Pararcticibacter amylolyticus TaxID=2173175 RepID=A0A2U2PAN4_9SPHI|nr:DUF2683 family protein [Pararcticibacter amylolyticus]PWG78189.1 hypothetical protein DDR33_23580 [Pararcticibacter amylolyticus]
MATLTVNIDNERDLAALKDFLMRLGMKYHITGEADYSDEFKLTLDNRYEEYKEGKVTMISAGESQNRIQQLLTGTSNNEL